MNMCAKDHIYYHLLSRNDQLLVNISFLLCNYLFRPSDLEFAYSDHVSLQSGGGPQNVPYTRPQTISYKPSFVSSYQQFRMS